jgi:hypothetical protein
VHGDVASEPPEWRAATDESGKEFVDIIYEKAVGEGIAKVRLFLPSILVKLWIPGKRAAAAAGFPRTFYNKSSFAAYGVHVRMHSSCIWCFLFNAYCCCRSP